MISALCIVSFLILLVPSVEAQVVRLSTVSAHVVVPGTMRICVGQPLVGRIGSGDPSLLVGFFPLAPAGPVSVWSDVQETAILDVFPNPAQNSINVKHNDGVDVLEVLDLQGVTVLRQDVADGGLMTIVDISILSAGPYIVVASSPTRRVATRFVHHP
jgi:hypothetical protein